MAADETNLNAVINVRGNFSGVTQQLSGLTSQIARLNAALLQSDAAAQDFKRSAFSAFKNGEMAGSGYTSQLVKLTSETEHFGKALDRQKLSLKDSSKALTGYYTGRSRQIQNLAREQAKLNRSFLVELGRDAGGGRSGALFTQTATNAGDMGMAAEVAAQKMSVLRGVMTNFNTALTNWGKNTQWAGRQLTVGLTVPLSIFAATAAKSFIEVDKELTRFKRVYGDAFTTSAETAKAVKAVQKTSQELAQGFGVSAKETAGLASDLAAAGYTGEKLQGALAQTSKIAILGEVDRQDALKTTLALQSAFNQNTQELAESVNFLNAVENQTSTSLQDLTTAIPKAGPVINSLGGDVKDLAVLLVALKEGGVSASEGANAIKSGIGSIVNPSKSAVEFLGKFNVNLSDVAKTATTDVVGGFVKLAQQLDNLSAQDRTQAIYKIFGKQQASRISALLQNIAKDGSQAQTAIKLAGSATSELAGLADKELTQYAEASSTRFKAAWESISTALLPVGEELVKVIVPALNAAYSAIVKFTDFISNAPDWVKNLVKVGAAAVFIAGPFIQLVGTLANLGGYIGKLGTGLFVLIRSILGLKTNKFEYLTKDIMASRLATDELTTSYLSQKEALRIVNSQLAIYLAQLKESALLTPGLYDEAQLLAIQNGNDPGAKKRGRRRSARPIRRSIGGTVPGVGTGDKVPAMLEPGEFVVRRSAVSRIGLDVLNNINAGTTKRFQQGGPAFPRPQDVAKASDFSFVDNFGAYLDSLVNQHMKTTKREGAKPRDVEATYTANGAAAWTPVMATFGREDTLGRAAPEQAKALSGLSNKTTDVIGSFQTLSDEISNFYGENGPLQESAMVYDKVDEKVKKRFGITEPGKDGIYQGTNDKGKPIQIASNAEVVSGAIDRTRSKIAGNPAQLAAFDETIGKARSSLFLNTDASWAKKGKRDPETGVRPGGFIDPVDGKITEFKGRSKITPYGFDYASNHGEGLQMLAQSIATQQGKKGFNFGQSGDVFTHLGASRKMTPNLFQIIRDRMKFTAQNPNSPDRIEMPKMAAKALGGTKEEVIALSDAARIEAVRGMGAAGSAGGRAFEEEINRELQIDSPSKKGKKVASDFVDGMEQAIPEAGKAGKETGVAYSAGVKSGTGKKLGYEVAHATTPRGSHVSGNPNMTSEFWQQAAGGPGVNLDSKDSLGIREKLKQQQQQIASASGVANTASSVQAEQARRAAEAARIDAAATEAAMQEILDEQAAAAGGSGGSGSSGGSGGSNKPPTGGGRHRGDSANEDKPMSRKEAKAEAKRLKKANGTSRGRMAVGGASALAGTALMFGAGESLGMSSGTSQIAGLGLTMLPSVLGSIPGPAGAAVLALAAVAAGIGYFIYKSNESVKKLRDQAENQFKTPDKVGKAFGVETKGAAFQRDRIQSGLGPTLTENQVKSIRTDYQGTINKLKTASTNELSNTLGDVYANLLAKGFGKAQAESILNQIAEEAGKKSIAVDIIANIIGVTGSSGNAALDAARARTEGFNRQSQSLSTSAARFQSGGSVWNPVTGKYDQGNAVEAQRSSDPLKLFYQNKNAIGQQNGILSTVKSVLFGPGGGNPFSSKIWDAAGVSMAEKLGAAVSSIPIFGAGVGLLTGLVGLNRANDTDKTNVQQGTDPTVFTAQANQYAGNVITDQNLSTGARYAALGYAESRSETWQIPTQDQYIPSIDPNSPGQYVPGTPLPYTVTRGQDTGILGKVNQTAGRQVDANNNFTGYQNQEVATKYIDGLAKQYDETNPALAAYIRLQKDANVATAAVQLSMAGLDYALADSYTPEQLKAVGAYYNEIEQGEKMMAAQEAALAKGLETAKAAVQAGAQQKIDAIDDEIKALEKRKDKINDGLEAQRDADSEAIDAIEKRNEKLQESLDKQIKPLEAQKKALGEARDATLKLLDAEQRRETFAETMKRSQIDLATAISSGDMVSAAKIQSEMDAANSANAKENARNSINDSTQAQLDAIDKREQSIKDSIQGQIDANNKKIKGIQDAAEAREKAAKKEIKAIDDTIEAERDRQQSIRDTASAAIKALDDIGKDDSLSFEQKIEKVNGVLTDTKGIAKVIDSKKIMSTFTSGVYTSIKDALPVITESLGLSSDPSSTTAQNQFLKGVEDAFKANGISVNHGGGEIGAAPSSGMKGNRAGRSMSAPLYRDEVPALLQRGEFVVQKDAVNKIGVDKLHQINAGVYHSGGPVGDNGGGALTASAAAVGGASMVTGLVARGAGRGIVNSLYPQIKDKFTKYIKGYTAGSNNANGYIQPSDGTAPNDNIDSYTMNGNIGSVSKAVNFLYGQIESGTNAWKQLCEKLARTAYGLPGMFPSALEHFRSIPANKKRNKNAESAPTGALGFWNTGPYGHIAVSTGNGSFFTNLSDGTVGIKSASQLANWGPLMGVTEPWWSNKNYIDIPGLAVGGEIMKDNVLANLHNGEVVLTKSLSADLKTGITRMSDPSKTSQSNQVENNFNIQITGSDQKTAEQISWEVIRKIEQRERQNNGRRTI